MLFTYHNNNHHFFLLTFRFERLKCLIDLTLFPYASTQSFGIVIP